MLLNIDNPWCGCEFRKAMQKKNGMKDHSTVIQVEESKSCVCKCMCILCISVYFRE